MQFLANKRPDDSQTLNSIDIKINFGKEDQWKSQKSVSKSRSGPRKLKQKQKFHSFKDRFKVVEPMNRKIDPEIVRAYTGKSDGILNTFDNHK